MIRSLSLNLCCMKSVKYKYLLPGRGSDSLPFPCFFTGSPVIESYTLNVSIVSFWVMPTSAFK